MAYDVMAVGERGDAIATNVILRAGACQRVGRRDLAIQSHGSIHPSGSATAQTACRNSPLRTADDEIAVAYYVHAATSNVINNSSGQRADEFAIRTVEIYSTVSVSPVCGITGISDDNISVRKNLDGRTKRATPVWPRPVDLSRVGCRP